MVSDEYPKPPAGERTDKPISSEISKIKASRVAARASSLKKPSVLIINDDNDIYFEDDQSVYTFLTAFKSMGYKVRIEESKDTSYSTWSNRYDIIVWSCGDDYTPINNTKSMQKLIDYVADKDARLLIESGNIAAWNKEFGWGTLINRKLRETVLQATTDWVYHDVGDLTLKTRHPIATTPNKLPDTISFTPTNPGDNSGDANAVRLVPGAAGIYNWSYVAYENKLVNDNVTSNAFGLVASEIKNGGRIVYFAFDIDDIDDPEVQKKLIQNSAEWLVGKKYK